jgi:hypothetical protein
MGDTAGASTQSSSSSEGSMSARTNGGARLAPESSRTQCGRILGRLIAAHGAEVPLYEISSLAAQYNARIWSLRKMGFVIENRTQEIDGVRHSFFRLVSSPAQAISPVTSPAAERVDSINSQAKPAGDVTSLPQQETLPFFPSGDR